MVNNQTDTPAPLYYPPQYEQVLTNMKHLFQVVLFIAGVCALGFSVYSLDQAGQAASNASRAVEMAERAR